MTHLTQPALYSARVRIRMRISREPANLTKTGREKCVRGNCGYMKRKATNEVLNAIRKRTYKAYVNSKIGLAGLRMRNRLAADANAGVRYGGYGPGVNREYKYVDSGTLVGPMDNVGQTQLIAVVPQGAGQTQRVGRKIMWRSIQYRIQVISDVATVNNVARWMIVYDRQPNKVLAQVTDILESASPYAFLKDENRDRFLVLKDKTVQLIGSSTVLGQQTDKTAYFQKGYLKLTRKQLQSIFSTLGTGAFGDITTGSLILLSIGTNAPGTTDGSSIFAARTRFDDM